MDTKKPYRNQKRIWNILYKKSTRVLLKITSGNIKKKKLKLKELVKSNK